MLIQSYNLKEIALYENLGYKAFGEPVLLTLHSSQSPLKVNFLRFDVEIQSKSKGGSVTSRALGQLAFAALKRLNGVKH